MFRQITALVPILNELKQLKAVISQLIGTSELPAKERFSKEAILKAGKEFQKLSIERGEWVSERIYLDKGRRHDSALSFSSLFNLQNF